MNSKAISRKEFAEDRLSYMCSQAALMAPQ